MTRFMCCTESQAGRVSGEESGPMDAGFNAQDVGHHAGHVLHGGRGHASAVSATVRRIHGGQATPARAGSAAHSPVSSR